MTRRERDLRGLARRLGWHLERTRGGHWRLHHPETGAVVIASFSPSVTGELRVVEGTMRRAMRDRAPLDQSRQRDVANTRSHAP